MKLSELFEGREKIIAYHGFSGNVVDKLSAPIHLTFEKKTAKAYAKISGKSGIIGKFEITLYTPLHLKTLRDVEKVWEESGIIDNVVKDEDWAASASQLLAFNKWAEKKGHDGIIIDKSAFTGNFAWDTWGDPQIIVFSTSSIKLLSKEEV